MSRSPILALVVLLAVTQGVAAQTAQPAAGAPTEASTAAPKRDALTLKERLGAKWKDEQRVDNCKVPPEKRGTKPRPDSCAHPKSQ